jgi:hypothetical protein
MMRQHPAERGEGAGAERESGEGLRGDVVWGPLVGAWGAVWGLPGWGGWARLTAACAGLWWGPREAHCGTCAPPNHVGCLQACGRQLEFQPNY